MQSNGLPLYIEARHDPVDSPQDAIRSSFEKAGQAVERTVSKDGVQESHSTLRRGLFSQWQSWLILAQVATLTVNEGEPVQDAAFATSSTP